MKQKGFTLLELLVVISIIGLLSTIAAAALNSARLKARAVRTIQDFQVIEKAILLLYDKENRTEWWEEGVDGFPAANPLIEDFPGLSEFLPIVPKSVIEGATYQYDNDGDDDTNTLTYDGINIFIYCQSECQTIGDEIDKIFDGSDGLAEGRFEYGNSEFNYGIPYDLFKQ